MKYKRCTICHLDWNVSEKDNQENYICPECFKKIPKVLLKNKAKFKN